MLRWLLTGNYLAARCPLRTAGADGDACAVGSSIRGGELEHALVTNAVITQVGVRVHVIGPVVIFAGGDVGVIVAAIVGGGGNGRADGEAEEASREIPAESGRALVVHIEAVVLVGRPMAVV